MVRRLEEVGELTWGGNGNGKFDYVGDRIVQLGTVPLPFVETWFSILSLREGKRQSTSLTLTVGVFATTRTTVSDFIVKARK